MRSLPRGAIGSVVVSVAAFGMLVTASGCARAPDGPPDTDPRFSAFVHDALTEATDGGAGEDQLAILQRIETAGAITYADYTEAVNATFECFTEAGIGHGSISGPNGGDAMPIYYQYESTGESAPVAEACIVDHSFWVERLYQERPKAVAAQEARFERAIPTLTACLEKGGYELPATPSVDEVKRALSLASSEEGSGVAPQGWSVTDCYDEAGL